MESVDLAAIHFCFGINVDIMFDYKKVSKRALRSKNNPVHIGANGSSSLNLIYNQNAFLFLSNK
jgi:hypothetical protein